MQLNKGFLLVAMLANCFFNLKAIDWMADNKARASRGELPQGSYLDDSRLRGCGWGSPTAAAIGIVGAAGAVGAGVAVAGASAGAAAAVGAGAGLAAGMSALTDLTKFLTCTIENNGKSAPSSIMTSLDADSRCVGDIWINSSDKLKCTVWAGSGARPEDIEVRQTPTLSVMNKTIFDAKVKFDCDGTEFTVKAGASYSYTRRDCGQGGTGSVIFDVLGTPVRLTFIFNRTFDAGAYMTLDSEWSSEYVMVRGIRTNDVLQGDAYKASNYSAIKTALAEKAANEKVASAINCKDLLKENINGGPAWSALCKDTTGVQQPKSYAYIKNCPDASLLFNCNGKIACAECPGPKNCRDVIKENINGGAAWSGICKNSAGVEQAKSYMYISLCPDYSKLTNCEGKLSCDPSCAAEKAAAAKAAADKAAQEKLAADKAAAEKAAADKAAADKAAQEKLAADKAAADKALADKAAADKAAQEQAAAAKAAMDANIAAQQKAAQDAAAAAKAAMDANTAAQQKAVTGTIIKK